MDTDKHRWDNNDMDAEDLELLQEIIRRQNKRPASYWEGSNKEQKENGVVQDFCESVGWRMRSIQSAKKDPPDCIAENEEGDLIGFEVVELVSQEAIEETVRVRKKKYLDCAEAKLDEEIRSTLKGEYSFCRKYSCREVIEEVGNILKRKDSKIFHGGPYHKLVLIVHNDETWFNLERIEQVRHFLRGHEFPVTKQITEVYLLFSYQPEAMPSYPCIQIPIPG